MLEEYISYATEVGEVSLRTEPGVLTIWSRRLSYPTRFHSTLQAESIILFNKRNDYE